MKEVVIKMPDEIYDWFVNGFPDSADLDELQRLVINGTVLPAGHGELKDADELKRHKYHDSDRFENAVPVAHIDWADTIIEADKENRV